ncbi:ABC transporter permease [Phenylobacterium sp.]|uniref:ABC transporter permease n=1 Tax=Phenylobacterium sp. TaxID=1871053 RepID=UPI00272EF70D|nr:ABC transporter permease [Phenylobacterium sp.]MDP1617897.1 ABC transporter permease [Phenylobacterium sp.]MDP1988628.1 ABC transporter permease [Phenylobacterium sp.]
MESAQHMLRTGRRGTLFEFSMALRDLAMSWDRRGLAWSLAWHDVVSRYRGSILGPFWITISMGLMVLGIGLLYARLFGISVAEFMPYVAMGIVFFGLMSGTINEGCETFVQARNMLSQTALPMFAFVWRTVLRNLINLAHHAVIIVAVIVVFGLWREMVILPALAGLVLTVLNLSWISMLAAIASARFRDIPQFVMSVMQFAIFMTPVFWKPDAFPDRHAFLTLNPFYHMLTTIRAPLLGEQADGLSYIVLAIAAVLGWALTFSVFAVTRRRIVHYL